MDKHNDRSCDRCMWDEECDYMRPCGYYIPRNYENLVAALENRYGRERFDREWEEYIAYWDDEADIIF